MITEYGPHAVSCSGLIYMHFLKNREGDLKVLKFKNELWRNAISEDIVEDNQESNNYIKDLKNEHYDKR